MATAVGQAVSGVNESIHAGMMMGTAVNAIQQTQQNNIQQQMPQAPAADNLTTKLAN